ncbi:phosphonate metabolism protein/1,5-bisphosphokinase (PRPP-forming) PhnN [Neptuniibacter sp. 2_MG-2023]|uniref:phosphonate metabolism protein/1,5-bisphosphokinase (PRPP-forming) PhnN n=1 Tax=Neptuniibacter sp. 2_MG-2023 TaxID=3062671 RepID=UPI0026E17FA9|nr:phosphonate metabolism protein/1,5-bisphosphokinase (PRPP-forming) PhnN [Neptuniibacter sp. 2_MG-2023]MDO6515372.1 phosphonate metabolism protein/1,5-bisphosphokinase (PRPP-forming) PhnN [Neptuniibacter sp. 2_MG-2023]
MSGHLYYLMGASGSGKDSLLQGCRQRLEHSHNVFIAHRYITRAVSAGGENHVHLTESEFELRKNNGMFCMHWASHGHLYGIGKEVEIWIAQGHRVIINGSRGHLAEAKERFKSITPIMVTVETEQLKKRLIQRGRESLTEIDQRLKQHASLLHLLQDDSMQYIDNNNSLEAGIDALMKIITTESTLSLAET